MNLIKIHLIWSCPELGRRIEAFLPFVVESRNPVDDSGSPPNSFLSGGRHIAYRR